MTAAIATNTRTAESTRAPLEGRARRDEDPDLARVHRIVGRLRLVTAPSRQKILLLLARGEHNVGAICAELENPSQPAVSHQLSLLRHGQLIECQRRGRNVYYRLTESGQAVARVFEILAKSRAMGRD